VFCSREVIDIDSVPEIIVGDDSSERGVRTIARSIPRKSKTGPALRASVRRAATRRIRNKKRSSDDGE